MGGRAQDGAIYDRALLRAGDVVRGPAIVIEMDSTTLIHDRHSAEVDRFVTGIGQQPGVAPYRVGSLDDGLAGHYAARRLKVVVDLQRSKAELTRIARLAGVGGATLST